MYVLLSLPCIKSKRISKRFVSFRFLQKAHCDTDISVFLAMALQLIAFLSRLLCLLDGTCGLLGVALFS